MVRGIRVYLLALVIASGLFISIRGYWLSGQLPFACEILLAVFVIAAGIESSERLFYFFTPSDSDTSNKSTDYPEHPS